MKCLKCGKELKETESFCPDCGQVVDEVKEDTKAKKEVVVNEKRIINSIENDTFFCMLSLILFVSYPLFFYIFNQLNEYSSIFDFLLRITSIFPFIAFALAVYAKVKYPKSKFAKVLLIVYIVLAVLAVIYIIIIIVACYLILRGCAESCSNMGYIFNIIFDNLKILF